MSDFLSVTLPAGTAPHGNVTTVTCVTEYLSVTLSAGGTASHRNVTTQLFPVPPTNDGALVPDVKNIVEVEDNVIDYFSAGGTPSHGVSTFSCSPHHRQ